MILDMQQTLHEIVLICASFILPRSITLPVHMAIALKSHQKKQGVQEPVVSRLVVEDLRGGVLVVQHALHNTIDREDLLNGSTWVVKAHMMGACHIVRGDQAPEAANAALDPSNESLDTLSDDGCQRVRWLSALSQIASWA